MTVDLVTNLRRHAANQGDKLALVDGARRWTYSRLWTDARRFGSALRGLGVRPRERVALATANRAEHVVALYGIAAAGAVAVPLPARAPGELLARMMADARCLAVGWGGPREEVPREVDATFPPERVLAFDEADGDGRAFAALLAETPPLPSASQVDPDDELVILYSSGTTGTPKGIVLTHACRVAYALGFCAEFGLSRAETVALLTPIYHNGAEMWLHSAVYAGATVVLAHGVAEVLDPVDAATPATTMTFLVPAQLRELSERAVGRSRAPLTVVTGTMPVGAAVKQEALERMPWCRLFEAYGLTEAGVLTALRPEEQAAHGDSIGRAFIDCELRLVDPVTGEPTEGQGELLAAGPCLMTGYNARDELNSQAFAGAFFRTGDIVRRDAEGYLRLLDRKDDLIVTGGVNVFARDVEAVLLDVAGVEQACVVGVPDPRWGEAVTAAVVLDHPRDEDELLDACRARLTAAQVPKRVVVLDELPRNAQGKVLRREVRALAGRTGERVG